MTISSAISLKSVSTPVDGQAKAGILDQNMDKIAEVKYIGMSSSYSILDAQMRQQQAKQENGLAMVVDNKPVNKDKTNQCHSLSKDKPIDHDAELMERARIQLLTIMVNEPKLLIKFAECYLAKKYQNTDLSDILTINNNKHKTEPVQASNFVQQGSKQIEMELNCIFKSLCKLQPEQWSQELIPTLLSLHFLPAFISYVADQIKADKSLKPRLVSRVCREQKKMMQCRESIIEANVRLVTYVAKQYKHSKLLFSDLIQEGTIGLIKAVDRFDYTREVKFSTYAIYWIKQTISRIIIKQEKIVRLPYSLAAKASLVFDTMNNQLELTHRWPSALELSELCRIPEPEVVSILKFYQPGVSLFSSINQDDDMPDLIDTLEQRHFPSPFSAMSEQAMHQCIDQAIDGLSQREADVIRARFGIQNRVEMTLQEIADQLQLSRERVRQIQNNAIQKLQKSYGNDLHGFLNTHNA